MNPISTQFLTVPSSTIRTLHSAIKDKLPLEEIKRYFNPRSINEKIDGMLPLDLAVLNNDEELIVELINSGATFKDDEAAFQEFCQEGHVERVRALINSGRIDKFRNFAKALSVACIGNKIETTRLLLNWNPSIPKEGSSIAHAVCLLGHYEILKLLIEIGWVDVNDLNPDKGTFLITAASMGAIDFVKWLLVKGAKPELRNLKGVTPFFIACEKGFLQLAQHLYAVCKAKLGRAQHFLNTQYTEDHLTVLHAATLRGRTDVIKWLLKEGANPLIKSLFHEMTSWECAWKSPLEIIKAFYESGKIDLNKDKMKDGSTILHFCSESSKPEVIRWLLKNGADRSLLDDDKNTPIEVASKEQKEENVKAFIANDFSNINQAYGIYKYTPLGLAVFHRMYPLVKWLLDNGADPSTESTQGYNPFTLACWYGELPTAQLLYEHSKSPKSNFKLDLNKHYGKARFPALMAAYKYPDIIKWLLDNGADPFLKSNKGYTLFSASCKWGELDSAKIIFQLGIDLNQTYAKEEITALHAATINDGDLNTAPHLATTLKKRAGVVEWLVEKGADPFIKDKSGKTPLEYAVEQKDIEIIKAYINALKLKIDGDSALIKFIDVVFPLLDLLLKNGTALSTFELSIQDHFSVSLKDRIKLLGLCSHLINWAIKLDSKSISEKLEELIALDVENKLTPLKDTKLTSNLGQEILDHFISFLYKHFPQLKSEKPGLISINKELFRFIREVVFKYKWMCDIQYNINIKLIVKSETSLEKLFEFIITLYNTLQQQRALIANGNTNDTVAIVAKSETKVLPKPAEPAPQIKPAKPQHISSSPSVNVPTTQKKPVKNKKVKGRKNQKGSAPKPQVITTAAHQKEHPSQVILAEPLPPLFPPQMIPLKTSAFDLESLVVDSAQPHKEDHQLSELKKILSSPEPLHLSLFDEVCKINRDHHQVPRFFAFDSWLIHSSHKIFHSDVMCDLFFQFVKQGYQDPFKPEQLLESFSTKHFIDELEKIDGDRKQTLRNMIKILPSLESKQAISGAIMIIGEQTARLKGDPILKDILDICMKYKAYRNLRHGPDSNLEEVQFDNEGVIEEGLINSGADWEEYLKKIINDLPADLIRLTQSRIMSLSLK